MLNDYDVINIHCVCQSAEVVQRSKKEVQIQDCNKKK
jgi:hypothetical protein